MNPSINDLRIDDREVRVRHNPASRIADAPHLPILDSLPIPRMSHLNIEMKTPFFDPGWDLYISSHETEFEFWIK